MEFVELKEKEFRKFASTHPLKTFLQTPEIGKLRKKQGWNLNYVGIKEKNIYCIGASASLLIATMISDSSIPATC